MKIFLFLSLALTLKTAVATLEINSFSDDQICMISRDPPLSVQVTYEINERKIICDDGIAVNESELSINKNSVRAIKFKKWNNALRGKGPVYSTRSGTNLKIDTFGDEKSIIIDRAF
tara:strand:- start:104 stop:454 length:351 start_codon:yes stop_codon:yes gene_type:complete